MIPIIITGAFVAIACGLLGNFLILRKMAMIGDAISHAVLPGLVISFLITGQKDSLSMFVGAVIFGLITTIIIEYLNRKVRLQTDAAIGVTFTFLFAVGVILLTVYGSAVDLDQDCVLHGEIAMVPLDLWILDNNVNLGPLPLYKTAFTLVIIATTVFAFFKPLYLTTFDPDFAKSLGIKTMFYHYLLMSAVSLTVVASFEVVGAILVIAFMIVPPATAYLLTDSFPKMIALTVVLGIIISITGYFLGGWLDSSIAGSMTVMSGVLFLIAFLFKTKRRAPIKFSEKLT